MINILEMLENTAEVYPDRTAFADPVKDIDFATLRDRAKKCATVLMRDKGVKSHTAVVFYMEKSVDAMTALLGGVYCNAFYCFIDIRQTAERAASILSVLEPSVIITDESNVANISSIVEGAGLEYPVLMIDELIKQASGIIADDELILERRLEFYDRQPLYVNFTSGSTGVPKGVVVGHHSVIDFITEFDRVFDITADDIIANQAPFDFDVSVKDIYSGLYTGAKVLLIPREYFSNPSVLMDYLCDGQVTTLIWAVSAMCFVSIMNGLEYKTPDKINKVMFSGELMPVKQLNKWKKYLPDATYVNLYGPTEITCNCTYHILDREYDKGEIIPIGIPFRNEKVFLLDDNDVLITDKDVEGEICVSGSCLALGYYKDPDKTAAVFVQNPVNTSYTELIYRTGDLGKYNDEGLLVYTSRKDFQIKHMGQRIELMDIEVSAMSIEGVSRACCLYDDKHKKIILFYVGELDKDRLSEELRKKLPVFMLPSKAVRLDEFPLNKNGKIDRHALNELV